MSTPHENSALYGKRPLLTVSGVALGVGVGLGLERLREFLAACAECDFFANALTHAGETGALCTGLVLSLRVIALEP